MIQHNLFLGIYTYYPKFLQRLTDKTTVSPESSSFFCVSGSGGEPPRYRLREIRTVSRPQPAVRWGVCKLRIQLRPQRYAGLLMPQPQSRLCRRKLHENRRLSVRLASNGGVIWPSTGDMVIALRRCRT